jgi:FMN-dependent NADH-azoreductase
MGPHHRMDPPDSRRRVRRLDLRVVEAEFTQVGVNPALDQLKDVVHQLRQAAEIEAHRQGRDLGAGVARSSAA